MIQYGTGNQKPGGTQNRQEIQSLGIQPKNQPPSAKLTVPQKDLVIFFDNYPWFCKGGFTCQGMILIAENMTNAACYCIQTIAFQLNAGEELSSSLRQYPVFEPIAIGLIEAGEAGGILLGFGPIALLLEERKNKR